ncbi:MazG nucleotide pyrophosphohydrolase domain-containing protein [Frondihabitans australicus]|uniref:XTP/dITP diphosphohydrolase n=1 Tax=Frondihabitans australicus TaxID=386892 RepID=A0A495IGX8_9MICO|nr:MazG nucleotide pyrophosphohydrolase domain-containing protein [Frondihabitans australicus]RKR75019.1 XTP/dITP diphosphohydrolase [Frondihabitans australicus]
MTSNDDRTRDALAGLTTSVDRLLDPPGCEWNRAQTKESLVTYLVEEAFELVEAIESGSQADLREELGDVLYQVVLQSGVAERAGAGFDLADVIAEVDEKVRRRHPHVFGDDSAADVDDIIRLWSAAKAREKASRESAYDGVPLGMPALARAQKLLARQTRAQAPAADGDDPVAGAGGHPPADLSHADTELAWGRALLTSVEAATARGFDAERALRAAVRERESDLRAAESRERRGTPQPE